MTTQLARPSTIKRAIARTQEHMCKLSAVATTITFVNGRETTDEEHHERLSKLVVEELRLLTKLEFALSASEVRIEADRRVAG